jgi:hypothetical protein
MKRLPVTMEVCGIICLIFAVYVIWWPMALLLTGLTLIFIAQGIGRTNR